VITVYFTNGDRVDLERATSAERAGGASGAVETVVVKEGGHEAAVFRFDQVIGWVMGEHGHTSGLGARRIGESNV
jgi:hypothetical protein